MREHGAITVGLIKAYRAVTRAHAAYQIATAAYGADHARTRRAFERMRLMVGYWKDEGGMDP